MNKSATVYSVPGCGRCTEAKNVLAAHGYAVEERDGEALARGEIRDNEAMAELMVTEVYPVITVDGRAVREGDKLYNSLFRGKAAKENEAW